VTQLTFSYQVSSIAYCQLLNKDSDEYPLSCWIVLCFLYDVTDNSKIYEEPSDGVIQTPSDYQGLHDKMCQQTHLRVQHYHQNKTSVPSYVKVNHHLQMSLQLSSQVSSNFIIQPTVSSQGSCAHFSTTSFIFECCIFLKNGRYKPFYCV
jgi:hypothetical protein